MGDRRFHLWLAWVNLRSLARHLRSVVVPPTPPPPPRGLTHHDQDCHPEPGHPSQLCRCLHSDIDNCKHDDDCPWLAAMCKDCHGSGWCMGCGGDGCDQGVEFKRWADENLDSEGPF
jgi:hypothetical protein